jgi:hypothetical protein
MWRDFPLTGIGLGKFQTLMTSYAAAAGDDLDLWIDNANSFYLWVLVEFGLLGLCILAQGAKQLAFVPKGHWLSTLGVVVLLFVLQFGPHLYFIEVSLLAAFLFSSVWQSKSQFESFSSSSRLLILCSIIWASCVQFGWYGWEQEAGHYQRWAGPFAQAIFHCDSDHQANLVVRSLQSSSLHLNYQGQIKIINLTAGRWTPLALDCATNNLSVAFFGTRSFVPALEGASEDWRLLSFQLRINPEKAFLYLSP